MNFDAEIHPTAILDQPYRRFQGGKEPYGIKYGETVIAKTVSIGPGVVLGKGVRLEEGVVIDSYCCVEPNTTLGRNTLLIYRAMVGGDVTIGSDCVIGGFIAENCIIGSRCRIFGQLIHRQSDTTESWDEHETPEPSPEVGDDSFIGFNSLVIGGLKVGPRSYICAGATVTRDVPPGYIAWGVNQLTSFAEWPGRLAENPIFLPLRHDS